MSMCASGELHTCLQCLRRPEEGVRSLRDGVTELSVSHSMSLSVLENKLRALGEQ